MEHKPGTSTRFVQVMMPDLGDPDAELVQWRRRQGDRVAKGDPLFEVLTELAQVEVPSPATGILTDIGVPKGHARVGSVLAHIAVLPPSRSSVVKARTEKCPPSHDALVGNVDLVSAAERSLELLRRGLDGHIEKIMVEAHGITWFKAAQLALRTSRSEIEVRADVRLLLRLYISTLESERLTDDDPRRQALAIAHELRLSANALIHTRGRGEVSFDADDLLRLTDSVWRVLRRIGARNLDLIGHERQLVINVLADQPKGYDRPATPVERREPRW